MKRFALPVLSIIALAFALACDTTSRTPRVEQKTETKSVGPSGTEQTTTKTAAVGDTAITETETKVKTPEGTAKTEATAVIGKVEKYEPGKSITLVTDDHKNHKFDLDDKNTTVSISAQVQVGTMARYVESKDADGHKTVSVTVEPGAGR